MTVPHTTSVDESLRSLGQTRLQRFLNALPDGIPDKPRRGGAVNELHRNKRRSFGK